MICALQIYTIFFRKIATTVSVNGLIHCEVSIFFIGFGFMFRC